MSDPIRHATIVPVAMLGLMAGFFYAFSICVMGGLDRIRPDEAIRAMQAINAVVRNPVFFVTFFLTPVIAGGVAITAFLGGQPRTGAILLVAAAIYTAGVVAVTATVHVPMNEGLAAMDAGSVDASRIWQAYSGRWTAWNDGRTLACLAALAVAALALLPTPD